MSKLFEDSDSDLEANIKTDNTYAKNYDNWRQKEELNKFKTKYGEEVLNNADSSTSSSEDEDDDAVHLTEELERDFFKTLASLKSKDPKVYDENVKFFGEADDGDVKKTKKKDQPMYIKDYERKLLLDGTGSAEDSEENTIQPKTLSYVEEQNKLKNSLKHVLEASDNEDDDNDDTWGGMLKSRKKSESEIKTEEEDYKQWLLGQKEDIKDDIKTDLKVLKDYWNDPKLDEKEKFLRDYILNNRFKDSEDKDYIPTYDEIIHDSDEGLSEDEDQIEKQEEFEHKYNYRFEEPDEDFIKRYPRTIENSLRRQDDRRKLKRAEVKERKQKEKQNKMQEIQEMKVLKAKEIQEKIRKLKEITGNTEIVFEDNDIEGDFDPTSHDKRMQDLFSDEFYQEDEGEQKPEFPDLDEELGIENWEQYESQEDNQHLRNEPHCEDENFNMDCDYDPTAATDTSKEKKKRRRKTKFAEVLSEPKPTFDPSDKTYEEYLDEYYKLECEDIIGDIPCRFKYRKVTPNNFGLTIEEILMANDRELNKWCSLKKTVQYRPEHVEKYDVIAFDRKGRNEGLKKKLLPSLFKEESSTTTDSKTPLNDESSTKIINKDIQEVKKKKKKLKETSIKNIEVDKDNTIDARNVQSELNLNDKTEIEIKINKKKKKRDNKNKMKVNLLQNTTSSENNNVQTNNNSVTNKNSNKTRKRKMNNQNPENLTGKPKTKFARKEKDSNIDISDARLKAFGFKPKKFKNKLKYGQKRDIK